MILVDQVTGDIYAYDDKLFISLGDIDHGRMEDSQDFLNNTNLKNASELQCLTGLIEFQLHSL